MKNILKILIYFLAVMLVSSSCKQNDDPKPDEPTIEDEKDYQTSAYSFTIGITPMQGSIEGVKLKNAFAAGDVIEISNPDVLYEPFTISAGSSAGKSSATFTGEMKIKKDVDLESGIQLTAVLKNGDKYNDGKPFANVIKLTSLADGINKYSYWSCNDFTFKGKSATINLTQSTVFVDFYMPRVQVTFKKGNAYNNKLVDLNQYFAVPFGYTIEVADFNFEKCLDDKDQRFYKISAITPAECLPGLFSVGADKYVYFSKGSLQYRPLDGKWRLAPQQYHKCFENVDEVGENYEDWQGEDKWTDLFWWGAWIEGGKPYLATLNDDDIEEYTLPLDATGNLTAPCAYGSMWTVLNCDEWNYILEQRPDAKQKRGGAIVDSIQGFVLLPDEWITPDGVNDLVTDYKIASKENVPNTYTKEEWEKMELAGAVFLPYIGQLFGSWILSSTNYQSRSFNVNSGQGNVIQFYLLENDCICYDLFWPNNFGHPVRLVQAPSANIKVKVE
ncbi:MAG: hypothetical protein IKQ70_10165 [Bacteroidales bacterium]|nr:hypothetical protein [Bacteroidales bacterium]